ncbi:MAG: porin family protein [Pseudomonadota bacterium]
MKCKYFIIVLILCLICAQSGWAKPAFGVRAGVNLANAKADPDWGLDFQKKVGFIFGPTVEFLLAKNDQAAFAIRLEMLYIQKGWKIEESESYYDYAYNFSATYSVDELVFAPFAVLRLPTKGITPYFELGPELGFNIAKRWKYEFSSMDIVESESGDIEDWADVNFGLNFGAGAAIPVGNSELTFGIRYNLGISNMDTYEEDLGEENSTIKTNGIQFLAGYNFSVPTK